MSAGFGNGYTARRSRRNPACSPASDSIILALGLLWPRFTPAETHYEKPPKNVLDVLHAPLPPSVSINPTHDTLILAAPVRYPPISDLAQPMLRLAGARVLPRNHGIHGAPYWSAFEMVKVADGTQHHVALPVGAKVGMPYWSADGKHYVFSNTTPDAIELWIGEAGSPKVRRLEGVKLNPMLGDDVRWMPDQRHLLVKLVPSDRTRARRFGWACGSGRAGDVGSERSRQHLRGSRRAQERSRRSAVRLLWALAVGAGRRGQRQDHARRTAGTL